MGNICTKCGLDHSRLGVEIRGTELQRSADKERHMLRINGGAWAFETALLSAHPEISTISIVDRNTGELWRVGRMTFDLNSFPFNASGRAQRALNLRHWNAGAQVETAPAIVEAVQPILAGMGSAPGVIYERAKKPRPRLDPKRHRRI